MTPLPHIHPDIYIGDDSDAHRVLVTQRVLGKTSWVQTPLPNWAIVHAAKSPWHVDMVGYHGIPAAPAASTERWYARRGRRLALNLIDAAPTPQHIPTVLSILDEAASHITESIASDLSVLVHCNMGLSRSPATVLWWLHRSDPSQIYQEALTRLLADHPYARQDSGIMTLVRNSWSTPLPGDGAGVA